MAAIHRITRPAPARAVPPSQWGTDWRRAWFRVAGSVHEHSDGSLIAFYGDGGDPVERTRLQDELDLRPGGVGEVLAAVRVAWDEWHARMSAACLSGDDQ